MFEQVKTLPFGNSRAVLAAALLLLQSYAAWAQVPNPTQRQLSDTADQPVAVFHVDVVARTMKAINYHHRQGSTTVDFRGTALLPQAKGEAKVDSKTGATKVEANFSNLVPAATFGPEFVTYVLWAITPEGRASNLGEVFLDGTHSSIQAATDLQAFGLMVTAEPYFAVTQPSDAVVMENFIRKDTTGTIEQVDAKYELIQRGVYTRNMPAVAVGKLRLDKSVPLDLQEARNAVAIARNIGADKYAADTFAKAMSELGNAEGYLAGRGDKKMLQTVARQATQMAEDARIITLKKMDADARQAMADRETAARLEAERQTQQRAAAEADRTKAEADRAAAERLRAQAESERTIAQAASQQALKDKAAADAARQAAIAEQQRLAGEATTARAAVDQAEKDKAALREKIRTQLNLILETRDTARGLIVNMSDVLFDTAKYTLKPGAREKLAKVSGIILAHQGLRLQVEGHTDSVGGDEYNQTLSEQRASSVKDYLVSQGIAADNVTSQGFGKTRPVASNDTAEGRQQNRRVELVVSGEIINGEGMPATSSVR